MHTYKHTNTHTHTHTHIHTRESPDILSSRATRKYEGGGYISEASLSDADAVVADRLMKIYRQCVEEEQCLLAVPFTSVDEYLHSLKV